MTRRHAGLDYVNSLERTFGLAAQRSGAPSESVVEIGGRAIRMRFAGDRLAGALTAALSHHPASTEDPDCTIYAFDAAAPGVALPAFPWSAVDVRERGEVRGFNDDRVRTLYETDSGMLSMFDVEGRRAFLAVDDERRLLWWQRAAPMRTIFHWIFTSPRTLLAHAAAVGGTEAGVLLAGPGGSGKSTTAVACVAAGLGYAGDDYVMLDLDGPPVAHSIYGTAKLTDESIGMLGSRTDALHPGSLEDEKRVLDVTRAFPHAITRALPITAIVLPRVARGGRTQLTPASAGAALRALAPTTIYQLPGNGGRALGQLAALVRRLPAYALTLGDDPSAPRLIEELLSDGPAQPGPDRLAGASSLADAR